MKSIKLERILIAVFTTIIMLVLLLTCDPAPAQYTEFDSIPKDINPVMNYDPFLYDNNIVHEYIPEENYSTVYVPTLILINTFITLEVTGNHMNQQSRNFIAISGMLTSTMSFFILNKLKTNHVRKTHKTNGYDP